MSPRTSRWLRAGLGLLLSAAGLYLALRGVDWSALADLLRRVHPGWLAAAVAAEMATIWLNAARWHGLFWPHPRPAVGRLFGILCVAQLANTVLPGRLGLPLRAVLAGDGRNVSRATALTTLAVEKLLEAATLLPLGLALFLLLDLPDWLRLSALVSAGLLLAMLLAVGLGLRWRQTFLAWVARRAPERLAGLVENLWNGLDSLRSARSQWRLWAWSLAYWAVVAVVNALVIRAAGLDVPPLATWVLLFVLQIGVRLPSSPANLGVFEYLGVVSLALFAVERTPALGAMLLLHLVFYLPPGLVGVGVLLWTSTGLDQLRRAASTLPER